MAKSLIWDDEARQQVEDVAIRLGFTPNPDLNFHPNCILVLKSAGIQQIVQETGYNASLISRFLNYGGTKYHRRRQFTKGFERETLRKAKAGDVEGVFKDIGNLRLMTGQTYYHNSKTGQRIIQSLPNPYDRAALIRRLEGDIRNRSHHRVPESWKNPWDLLYVVHGERMDGDEFYRRLGME